MCGRYAIAVNRYRKIELVLDCAFAPLTPRYNIAPTLPVPVIRPDAGGSYEMVTMRWGLVPAWSKEPTTSYSTHNAMIETVAQKPAYRQAYRSRRCLVPASGFYEWAQEGGRKVPWYFTVPDGQLAFAGLWECWQGASGSLLSCSILVGPANEVVGPVHDRMPCILLPEHYRAWMSPETPAAELPAMLSPFPATAMQAWRVSPRVNNARHDDPDLPQPLTP